ncbi:hypothetical protein GCM10029963_30660 [Micromonospora andamanensis]
MLREGAGLGRVVRLGDGDAVAVLGETLGLGLGLSVRSSGSGWSSSGRAGALATGASPAVVLAGVSSPGRARAATPMLTTRVAAAAAPPITRGAAAAGSDVPGLSVRAPAR